MNLYIEILASRFSESATLLRSFMALYTKL
jgi:hypothetical protein